MIVNLQLFCKDQTRWSDEVIPNTELLCILAVFILLSKIYNNKGGGGM